ncbi:hypothetical protein OpiT1DRAFT_01729 [Opitutaceae bacterium TAV1]|nr:hypothetical protein OpiT1DRAFT_01729 [Opitutaceae bacterium TAV1]
MVKTRFPIPFRGRGARRVLSAGSALSLAAALAALRLCAALLGPALVLAPCGHAALAPFPPLRGGAPASASAPPAEEGKSAAAVRPSGPAPAVRILPPVVIPASALPPAPPPDPPGIPAAATSPTPPLSPQSPPLDPADIPEVIRRHLAAIGGEEAVSALRAIAVKGTLRVEGRAEPLQFEMWSARPDRVLIRTLSADRTFTKGYDGASLPWTLDSAEGDAAADMAPKDRRAFIAEAGFDDVLVASATRGSISIDYAGKALVNDRPAARYLVTQDFTEVSHLFVDLETLHIVRRDARSRSNAFPVTVQNYFFDYKPVNGVLLPTRIVQEQNGRVVHVMHNEHVEPNPVLDPAFFSRPATAGAASP